MSMYLKDAFGFDGYEIGVVEAKEFVLKRLDVKEETIVTLNVDARILTCIANVSACEIIHESNEILDFDYLIYVYDYEQSIGNDIINKAIMFHELGHIYYPPNTIQQEVNCDRYAIKHVGAQAVCDTLNMTIREIEKLGKSTEDLKIRKIVSEAFLL